MHLWIANCAYCKFGSFCMSDGSNVGLRLPCGTMNSWFPALILNSVIVSGTIPCAPAAGSSVSVQIRQLLQSKPRDSKAWLLRAGLSATQAHFQIMLTGKTAVMSPRFQRQPFAKKDQTMQDKHHFGCLENSYIYIYKLEWKSAVVKINAIFEYLWEIYLSPASDSWHNPPLFSRMILQVFWCLHPCPPPPCALSLPPIPKRSCFCHVSHSFSWLSRKP